MGSSTSQEFHGAPPHPEGPPGPPHPEGPRLSPQTCVTTRCTSRTTSCDRLRSGDRDSAGTAPGRPREGRTRRELRGSGAAARSRAQLPSYLFPVRGHRDGHGAAATSSLPPGHFRDIPAPLPGDTGGTPGLGHPRGGGFGDPLPAAGNKGAAGPPEGRSGPVWGGVRWGGDSGVPSRAALAPCGSAVGQGRRSGRGSVAPCGTLCHPALPLRGHHGALAPRLCPVTPCCPVSPHPTMVGAQWGSWLLLVTSCHPFVEVLSPCVTTPHH